MAFSSSFDNPAAPGTGSAVSNREDLTSLLTQLDPTSTPNGQLMASQPLTVPAVSWKGPMYRRSTTNSTTVPD